MQRSLPPAANLCCMRRFGLARWLLYLSALLRICPRDTCAGPANAYRFAGEGPRYDASRTDGKATRYQARERLELEIHLRADRRHAADPGDRSDPGPPKAHQAAGRQCGEAV